MTLALTLAVILSFIIMMYVLLDGFDLGIGILFLLIHDPHERDIIMSSVTPVWDGNETWLVFGAAVLYAAFPKAYGILLPMLYMPILIMLAALIFRGVAFEFRFKAQKTRGFWDIAFSGGSILAAFMQGVILGTFVSGYGETLPAPYSTLEWVTPFNLMTGLAVVAGYALLGSNWLIIKTQNSLQQKMYLYSKVLLAITSGFLIIVSIWTPSLDHYISLRWFSYPNYFYLFPLPLLTIFFILYEFYCLKKGYEKSPFFLTIALFLFSYIGFCISSWPYIIPHSLTLWQAAAEPSSLKFLLAGILILLPILLVYTAYAYRVFSGKITESHHY